MDKVAIPFGICVAEVWGQVRLSQAPMGVPKSLMG